MKRFLILFLLFSGCLRKQGHEVKEPEWPRVDLGGWVRDTLTGEPVPEAYLTIQYIRFAFPDTVIPYQSEAVTDSEGYFVFRDIPIGVLNIYQEAENYCQIEPKEIVLDFMDRYDVEIKMVEKGYYRISGYVYDYNSQLPLRNVQVLLTYTNKLCPDSTTNYRVTSTNSQGFFLFENLPQGIGGIRFRRLSYFDAYYSFNLFNEDITDIEVYMVPIP
jgi:hypothetical protein